MKWYNASEETIMDELKSSPEGLPAAEALMRLRQYGSNTVQAEKHTPGLVLFFSQFADFMTAILLVAAVIAGVTGNITDTAVIISVVILNAVVGFIYEYRAKDTTESLKKMNDPAATVMRGANWNRVPSADIVPGDIVFVKAGDAIPADLRFIETTYLKVNESPLTGESEAVEKNTAVITLTDIPAGEMSNMGFKGTYVVAGFGRGLVVATGMSTELGRIAAMLQQPVPKTPLQRRMERFGKSITYIILVLCAIIFILGWLRGENAMFMLLMSVSVAVAAIPEALPAIITVALAAGAAKMAKKKALVKKLSAVETLGSVTYICTDKTGTLTRNKMTLDKIAGTNFSVLEKTDISTEAIVKDYNLLMTAIALNNDVLRDGNIRSSGDPTEIALYEFAAAKGYDTHDILRKYPRVAEIPFDPERKCMTTVHLYNNKYIAFVKGAVDVLLENLEPTADIEKWAEVHDEMLKNGLRVMAFATKEFVQLPGSINHATAETGLTMLGIAGIIDPPRDEVKRAIEDCRNAGIVPVIITGDHPATAMNIAKRVGIVRSPGDTMITGSELNKLGPAELQHVTENTRIYARVTPAQKLEIIKALQNQGQSVAMTGDGINDAPALKHADIGVSMNTTGTDVAKEAAQIILLDDNFATIITAVKEGRRIFENIRRFIHYILACNLAELCVVFFAFFLNLPLPLLPVQILWMNLVTDGVPALALVNEPADKNILHRKPYTPSENFLSGRAAGRVVMVGLFLCAVTLAAEKYTLSLPDHPTQTVVFTILCWGQLFHALAVRSDDISVFRLNLLSNKPLTITIAVTFLVHLLLIYLPFLHDIFKTQALTGKELGICFFAALLVLVPTEIGKMLMRVNKN